MTDIGVKFKFNSKGTVFEDLVANAKRPKAILAEWGKLLKDEAKELMAERAPPLAPATIKKQQHQGTSSVTAQGKVRASYAKGLDTLLKRKGINATAELRRLASGDTSRGSVGIKVIDRLRRKVERAQKLKAAVLAQRARDIVDGEAGYKGYKAPKLPQIAIGKKTIERTGGERGGKFRKAWTRVYEGLSVAVVNAWDKSGIHDTGGKVGNGATLPNWNFTEIRQKVRDQMSIIAIDWLLRGGGK